MALITYCAGKGFRNIPGKICSLVFKFHLGATRNIRAAIAKLNCSSSFSVHTDKVTHTHTRTHSLYICVCYNCLPNLSYLYTRAHPIRQLQLLPPKTQHTHTHTDRQSETQHTLVWGLWKLSLNMRVGNRKLRQPFGGSYKSAGSAIGATHKPQPPQGGVEGSSKQRWLGTGTHSGNSFAVGAAQPTAGEDVPSSSLAGHCSCQKLGAWS